MNRLATLARKPAVQFTFGPIKIDRELQVTENDLGEVLNIWTPDDFVSPLPHVTVEQKSAPEGSKLNLLWVGSSFNWTLLDLLTQTKSYEKCDFLYYDRTRYRFPPPSSYQNVRRMKFAERTDLLSRQVVILEINEAALIDSGPDTYGPRFVSEGLEYLRSLDNASKPSANSARAVSQE